MPGPKSSPRPMANPRRGAPMSSMRPRTRSDSAAQASMDRARREQEREMRAGGMKRGGMVRKMARGGMCRGMGAAKRGGEYRTM